MTSTSTSSHCKKRGSARTLRQLLRPISGYSCLHIHREMTSRGGGLALVYRQSLDVKPYLIDDIFKPSSFEVQLTKLKSTQPPTTIVNIYRPPASSRAVFLDELAELISVISADTIAGLRLCVDMSCAQTNADNIDDDLLTTTMTTTTT